MGQPDLSAYVTEFKTDVKQGTELDSKTVAERSNMANMSALDFLLDMSDVKTGSPVTQDAARDMFHLADELNEITEFFDKAALIRS